IPLDHVRHEARDGPASASEGDLLTSLDPFDKARQVCLGLVDVDRLRHAGDGIDLVILSQPVAHKAHEPCIGRFTGRNTPSGATRALQSVETRTGRRWLAYRRV